MLEVPLPGVVRKQHPSEERADDRGEPDVLRERGHEQTDDECEDELVDGAIDLPLGFDLAPAGIEVIVYPRDDPLTHGYDGQDEDDRLKGDGCDATDGQLAGVGHALDYRQDDHPQNIVYDGGGDDDAGLLGIHQMQVLDDPGGYSDGCGHHRRTHEHRMVQIARVLVHQDDRESRYERKDDTQDGAQEGGPPGSEKVLDLGLQTHCEQEEHHSQLCHGIDYVIDVAAGFGPLSGFGHGNSQRSHEGPVAEGEICHHDSDDDLAYQTWQTEPGDNRGAQAC